MLAPVLAVMALRVAGVVSFAEPMQMFTSGDESASLFAMWKVLHGQDVYTSRFEPPFNAVFFNWLYYWFYGGCVDVLLTWGGLAEAWLPTAGRLVTLTGGGLAWLILALGIRKVSSLPAWTAAAAAATVVLGPLVGFWLVTVRPDLWALALDLAGMLVLLTRWRHRPWSALAGFALAAWLAWSFKQAAVTSLCGVGLFLLIERQWRGLAMLVSAMALAFAVSLAAGTPLYRATVMFSGVPLHYSATGMVVMAGTAIAKALPVWMALAVALALSFRRGERSAIWADDITRLLACTAGVGLVLALAAMTQDAAAENYMFIPTAHAALLAARLWVRLKARRLVAWAAMGGMAVLAGLGILMLAGRLGVLDQRPVHAAFMRMKACVQDLPRPLFVHNPYLSLPWMSPSDRPYVLSFVYDRERALGKPFAGDGIGGLVGAGHFAAIAIPGDEVPKVLDGAALDGYVPVTGACHNLVVLLRRDVVRRRDGADRRQMPANH